MTIFRRQYPLREHPLPSNAGWGCMITDWRDDWVSRQLGGAKRPQPPRGNSRHTVGGNHHGLAACAAIIPETVPPALGATADTFGGILNAAGKWLSITGVMGLGWTTTSTY